MNDKMKFLTFSFLILLTQQSFAQNILLLRRKGEYDKKIIFEKGDEIIFKMDENYYWTKGKIDSVGKDFIMVNQDYTAIDISRIHSVKTKRKNFNFYETGVNMIITGLVFPVIALAGMPVNSEFSAFTTAILIISSQMVISGIILKTLQWKIHHVGRRRELKIVSL